MEEQIIELSKDNLCTIGSHTNSHPKLSELSIQEQQEQIEGCKMWLEHLLKHPIAVFAYPYGDYSAQTIELLPSLGIDIAFAGWGGGIRKFHKQSLLTIPRFIVTETRKYG